MNHFDRDNSLWDKAWEWVIREHEQPLDPVVRTERVAWLKADPAHLTHYEEANQIWLAAALVPRPADDPGVDPDIGDSEK